MKHHCINLDWLEVYCIEPEPLTPDCYERKGYKVHVRTYGTPTYRQMFTIYDGSLPLFEVRRDPYSLRNEGGIFEVGSCHIRLTNRACYRPEPVNDLRNFILAHGYHFMGITRLDIAFDFQQFDNRMKPETLIRKIFDGEVAKINQANIAAHGKDSWDGQQWNSLKWGSESSAVSTKLYNKTLELRTHASKYYIVDSWAQAGLAKYGVVVGRDGQIRSKVVPADTDTTVPPPEDTVPEINIWRVEFALKTEARNWLRTDTGEIFELRLSNIDTRAKLLFLWRALANHYFHFKVKTRTRDGQPQRKDRCPDLPLSRATVLEESFKVHRIVTNPDPTRTEKILMRKLVAIAEDENLATEAERTGALRVVQYFAKNRADATLDPVASKLRHRLAQAIARKAVLFDDPSFRPDPAQPSADIPDIYDYPLDQNALPKPARDLFGVETAVQ